MWWQERRVKDKTEQKKGADEDANSGDVIKGVDETITTARSTAVKQFSGWIPLWQRGGAHMGIKRRYQVADKSEREDDTRMILWGSQSYEWVII